MIASSRSDVSRRVVYLCLWINAVTFLVAKVARPSTYSWTGNSNDVVTCRGRCGQDIGEDSPCSCGAKCLVQKNCCEDFQLDCTQLVSQLPLVVKHMLSSHVKCSTYNILMVDTCPEDPLFDLVGSSPDLESPAGKADQAWERKVGKPEISIYSDGHFIPSDKMTTEGTIPTAASDKLFYLKEHFQAPITDHSTGLTFTNSDIFHCNGGIDSNALVWLSLFSLKITRTPTYWTTLADTLLDQHVMYEPPKEGIAHFSGSKCQLRAISSCPNKTEAINKTASIRNESKTEMQEQQTHLISYLYRNNSSDEAERMCGTFQSYVSTVYVVYSNRFCLFCNEGEEENFVPLSMNTQFDRLHPFSAIFTIGPRPDLVIIEAVLLPEAKYPGLDVSWSKMQCSMKDENRSPEPKAVTSPDIELSECQILECWDDYQLKRDGLCRIKTKFTIAFTDNGMPFSSHEIEMLPKFMLCAVEKSLMKEIQTDRGASLLKVGVASSLFGSGDEVLYYIEVNGYALVRAKLLFDKFNGIRRNLGEFAVYVHALHHYRNSWPSNGSNRSVAKTVTGRLPRTFNVETLYLDLVDGFEESRGKMLSESRNINALLSQNATTSAKGLNQGQSASPAIVCAGTIGDYLGCWQDAIRERDVTVVEQLLMPGADSCINFLRSDVDTTNCQLVLSIITQTLVVIFNFLYD